MPRYTAPGVYIGQSATTRRIEGHDGRLPAFIGQGVNGPVDQPQRVNGWNDYINSFGGDMTVAMNRDVYAYFLNTAQPCYIVRSSGSVDSSAGPDAEAYRSSLRALAGTDQVNTLLLPGNSWLQGAKTVIELAIADCERMRDRMIILDPPAAVKLTTSSQIQQLSLPTSSHAVSYYPWLRIRNPDYEDADDPGRKKLMLVSPAAVAAAKWVETDTRRGVWKAPAGLDVRVAGVRRVQYAVDAATQSIMNPLGINCIRKIRGTGTVIWGARTRASQTHPEWKYISVRRTAQYIESSIRRGIEWAVFEPNNESLWMSLRQSIDTFMTDLFRAGALQGSKSSDAWFTRCGLGQTMTQSDIDRGRVVVQVGFAPLKPAEFVVLRVVQKTAA